MASKDELACVYAAFILMDDDIPVTAEKLQTVLKAADVNVEPYWPGLFAKAAASLDLKSMVSSIAASGFGGGGAPAAGAPSGGAAAAPAAAVEKKVEKEEEPEEESDEDMGFGLFD